MNKRTLIVLAGLFASAAFAASDFYTTSNMGLSVPIPGVATGPNWANDINASLTLIDSHDHSPGKGVAITPLGMNITSNLPFNGNFATSLGAGVFAVQSGDPSSNACVYSKGVDLYYKDGNGNVIQITSGGGVNGSPGSISNLASPASASFVSANGTFVWQQGTSTAANMDEATLILRYPGSYPAPSGNYIAIQAPTSLATGYAITLPGNVPGATNALLTESTGGIVGYTNVDGSTLMISTGTMQVPSGGITSTQLATAAVGSAKIASNAVTPAKLSSANISVSSSSGAFTSTNASPVSVVSTALTASGSRPVSVYLISDGTSNLSCIGSATGATYVTIYIYKDGSPVAYSKIQAPALIPPSFSWLDTSPTAGSHTYALYISNQTTSGGSPQAFYTKIVAQEQ